MIHVHTYIGQMLRFYDVHIEGNEIVTLKFLRDMICMENQHACFIEIE
jgi:hypothetical protein